MSRLIALMSVALLLLASLTPATASSPPPTLPVDLVTSRLPATLVKGDTLEIAARTCRPLPDAPVRLQRRLAPDGAWAAVRTDRLDPTGAIRFTVAPNGLRTFDFRIRVGGSQPVLSPAFRVRMVEASNRNPSVGLVRAVLPTVPSVIASTIPDALITGTAFELSAAACPMDDGAPVAVERRVSPDGSWATVRTSVLGPHGTETFTLKPNSERTFDFRVRVAGRTNAVSDGQQVVVQPLPVSQPVPEQTVAVSDIPSTLVTGDSFAYTVSTDPAAADLPVRVEKRVEDGDWFTVRDTRLTSEGTQTFELAPVAKRSYSFRAIVGTESLVTSRSQTVTVVAEPTSDPATRVPRYQLFDDRSTQSIRRGRWVTLRTYPTRDGVPTKNIMQLNLNVRAATGDRPQHVLVGWQRKDDGMRIGVQTLAVPTRTGDRPFQVAHDFTAVGGGNLRAQLFIPGSGEVALTTEVVKAIAHPSG